MIIIDPDGLFNGDRLRNCSNTAQLHFPRLLLASNGFARLEINYPKIIGVAYSTFKPVPSEADLQSWIQEYVENYLLCPYEADGRLWGQWDAKPELLPRYKTSGDRRSPKPPEPAFTEWKKRYRTEIKAFPKCLGEISETFHGGAHVVVVAVVDAVEKNICASDDARLGQLPPIHDPPFGTDLGPLPEQPASPGPVNEKPHKSAAAKTGNSRATELASQQEAWFRTFWADYWRRRSKKDAWNAFRKCVRTEERFQIVLAAMRAQKPEMLQREPAKRPYGATWLRGERWEDEQDPAPPTDGVGYRPMDAWKEEIAK